MDYFNHTYTGYGEDRSVQFPPLFPGGSQGGQPIQGIPGGQGSFPPYFPGGTTGDSRRSFLEEAKVRFKAFPYSCHKAICLPC